MTKFLILGVVLSLVGCATTNVGRSYTLTDNSGEGLAVASLSYAGLGDSETPTCYFRRVGSEETRSLMLNTLPLPLDWKSPPGALVYFALPAGRYEFFRCGLTRTSASAPSWHIGKGGVPTNADPNYAGFDSVRYPSNAIYAKPFSIPFEILSGKATYAGNLHFTARIIGSEVVLFDRSERDLSLLRQRLPQLRAEQIRIAIPATAVTERPATAVSQPIAHTTK